MYTIFTTPWALHFLKPDCCTYNGKANKTASFSEFPMRKVFNQKPLSTFTQHVCSDVKCANLSGQLARLLIK